MRIKKYSLGGLLLGQGVNLVANHFANQKQKKIERGQTIDYVNSLREQAKTQNLDRIADHDASLAPVQGGGFYMANGGRIAPLSATANLIVGDKHGQDTDGDGREGVPVGNDELEGGEVEQDGMVFSKRLGYADKALKIINTPAYKAYEKARTEGEAVLNNKRSGLHSVGTAKRNIEKLDNPLAKLFNEQEMYKAKNNIKSGKKMLYGGRTTPKPTTRDQLVSMSPKTVKGGFDLENMKALPTLRTDLMQSVDDTNSSNGFNNFLKNNKSTLSGIALRGVDNIINSFNKTPNKLPKPRMMTPSYEKVNFDVNPLVSKVNQTTYNRIKGNSRAFGADAKSENQKAYVDKLNTLSSIYDRKRLVEDERTARNLQEKRRVDGINYNAATTRDNAVYMNKESVRDANMRQGANLQQDINSAIQDNNINANDRASMAIILQTFNEGGVLDRKLKPIIDKYPDIFGKWEDLVSSGKATN